MRDETEMIYQQKINSVVDFISGHLHQPLTLGIIAGRIHVSQSQLLRIMRTALNEPLSAYIARQRLERAVMYMQTDEMNLTELSEKVGYDNPQSFSKAFKKFFGTSPKAYRRKLQAKLSNATLISGNRQNSYLPEICEVDGMELVYIRITGNYGENEPYTTAWRQLTAHLKQHQALSSKTRFIGISFDDPNVTNSGQCRFYACASVYQKITPTGAFGVIQLRKGKYAVYTLKGSYSGLQELYNHISVNFAYTLRHGIAFEEYLNSPLDTPENNLLTKIFIPIK
jgi:AraC-like DNA-binding protein/DNA gyrase inhibitor GyrI